MRGSENLHAGRTDAPCREKLSSLCRKTKEQRWINAALFVSLLSRLSFLALQREASHAEKEQ